MLPQQNDRLLVRASPSQVYLWEIAWRHRLFLALSVMTSVGAGVFVYTLLPVVYQSTAQVLVWQKRPDPMLAVDNRNGVMEDTLATQQELLKSTVILDRAIRECQLEELSSLQAGKETMDEMIRKELTVSRGKGSGGINNVIQVSYRGTAADECAAILGAVVESYKKFLNEKYEAFAGDTLKLVLRERVDLEKELERKEADYRAFLEMTPLVLKKPDGGGDLSRDRLTSIQTKRSTLLLRRAELQSQLEGIESALRQGCSRETILALIAEFARKGDEQETNRMAAAATPDQLTPLLLEEQKLLERYGADHPEVRSARKRIAIARNVLVVPASAWDESRGESSADPVQRHVQILRQKLRYVTETEEKLRQLFDDEHEQARKLARYEIQEEALRTGVTLTRQSYDVLNKRLQETHLLRNAGGYDVEIVSPPSAGRKVAPSLAFTLAAAAALGLLAPLGLVYLRETTRRKRRLPEDVRQPIGSLPSGAEAMRAFHGQTEAQQERR